MNVQNRKKKQKTTYIWLLRFYYYTKFLNRTNLIS